MIFALIVAGVRRLFAPKLSAEEIDAALAGVAKDRELTSLDWRGSIVDLLKLLDIDPSMEHRSHLWGELGFKEEYTGSAQQNRMMIEEVRRRFADGELD